MSKIPTIAMIPSGYKANKLYSVLPTNGDADLAFTRVGEASRINQLSLQETLLTGVPRLDYSDGGCPSLLVEPARKNLFLNSETGATQTITVVSGVDYAVSFSGTGSITFSGGATGTLNGTGANAVDRISSIVTTSSTSVTCTISGTVEYVNFEINTDNSSVTYATSWIETTGTIATRVAETVSKTGLSSYINSSEGVLYAEIKSPQNTVLSNYISLSDGTFDNRLCILFSTGTNVLRTFLRVGGAPQCDIQTTNYDITNYNKIALSYKENEFKMYVNGVQISVTDTSGDTFSANTLSVLAFSEIGGAGGKFEGNCKDLRVYNEALTDAELIALTS